MQKAPQNFSWVEIWYLESKQKIYEIHYINLLKPIGEHSHSADRNMFCFPS